MDRLFAAHIYEPCANFVNMCLRVQCRSDNVIRTQTIPPVQTQTHNAAIEDEIWVGIIWWSPWGYGQFHMCANYDSWNGPQSDILRHKCPNGCRLKLITPPAESMGLRECEFLYMELCIPRCSKQTAISSRRSWVWRINPPPTPRRAVSHNSQSATESPKCGIFYSL